MSGGVLQFQVPPLVTESSTGFVLTSCPQLPGGPGPESHGRCGEAHASWGGWVPDVSHGQVRALQPTLVGFASEMMVLNDVFTFLLMKTVTLACNLLQNPVQ